MKVAVVGTRGIPNLMGGIETHCEELYPRIVERGFDVTIIRRSGYSDDHLTDYQGCRLVDVPSPKINSLEVIVHTFKAIFTAKRLGADVVHIHAIGPALLAPIARLLGMKVVLTHHGSDYERDKWKWYAKAVLRMGEWFGMKYANRVIVISQGIKDAMARKYGREDCALIYNGVSEAECCDYPDYFTELGIEKGKYVLGMSRIEEEKNLHHLIMACSKLDMKDCRVVIAGDTYYETNYSRKLKELARKYQVVLTGFVRGKKLHSLLTNAKCFVLPSSHEGLPIALLEAMSYQLPVIVSDIPANKEIGLEPESYFHVGDVDELSRKLHTCIDNEEYRVNYHLEKYDWNRIADQVCTVYQSL